MNLSGSLSAINSGYVAPLITDAQLEEGFERLVRSAAILSVKEAVSGLSGIQRAGTIQEFDDLLYDDIENKTFEGIEMGGLEPLTQQEFVNELRNVLDSNGMAGIFSKISKKFKKVARLVISAPLELQRRVFNKVKKVVKKNKKLLKKVAIAAAVGATVWYAGPAALALGKTLMDKGKAVYNRTFGPKQPGGTMGPPAPPGYYGPQPLNSPMGPPAPPGYGASMLANIATNSNAITDATKMAQTGLLQQGLKFATPSAIKFLKGAVKGQLVKLQNRYRNTNRMGPPPPPGYIPRANQGGSAYQSEQKSMLPMLAVGAGALFMLK